jgi:prophage regulatory protein
VPSTRCFSVSWISAAPNLTHPASPEITDRSRLCFSAQSSGTIRKRVDSARKPLRPLALSDLHKRPKCIGGPVSEFAAGKSREMGAITWIRSCAATKGSAWRWRRPQKSLLQFARRPSLRRKHRDVLDHPGAGARRFTSDHGGGGLGGAFPTRCPYSLALDFVGKIGENIATTTSQERSVPEQLRSIRPRDVRLTIGDPVLMGSSELSELIGVSRTRIQQLTELPTFPRPVASLRAGRVWDRRDIDEWLGRSGRVSRRNLSA